MERTMKYTLLLSALFVGAVGALTISRYMAASEPKEEEMTLTEEELGGAPSEAEEEVATTEEEVVTEEPTE